LRRSPRLGANKEKSSAPAERPAARAQPERGSARAGRSAAAAPQQNDDPPRATHNALMSAIRDAAATDDAYQRWLQAPPPDTRADQGLLYDAKGCMLVPTDAALRTRILAELHDSPTGAHCGRDRLLAELQKRFAWQGMATDAEQYVLTCDACQRNKHSKQLTPGLMMPLPLPEEPCLHWTTDAVTGLPKTKQGHDAIQVYVDRLTKLKRFAVARTSDNSVRLA